MTGRRITGRRIAALAAAGALGLTLVACGPAAGEQLDTAGQSEWAAVEHVGATGNTERLPVELRADLEELRDLPADQRRAAAEDIRDSALAGEYGEDVQQRVERLAQVVDRLPVELRADLEELRDLPADQRRAAAEDIRDSALAGEYGEDVQQRAERLAERRDGHQWDGGPLAQRLAERFGD